MKKFFMTTMKVLTIGVLIMASTIGLMLGLANRDNWMGTAAIGATMVAYIISIAIANTLTGKEDEA